MHDTTSELEQIWDIPASAAVKVIRPSEYGSVPGLSDEELADPEELERVIEWDLYGPVLSLPRPRHGDKTWTEVYGAKTEKRARLAQDSDTAASSPCLQNTSRREQLRDQLRTTLLLLARAHEHVPGSAKYTVLKCLRMGIISMHNIVRKDLLAVAMLDQRTRRLQEQIALLEQRSMGEQGIACRIGRCHRQERLNSRPKNGAGLSQLHEKRPVARDGGFRG